MKIINVFFNGLFEYLLDKEIDYDKIYEMVIKSL
jgi:hypothetical protein